MANLFNLQSNNDLYKLISPNRFDLIAKYIYIKFKDKKVNSSFYYELYHAHMKTFNNCWEYPGTKTNIEEFITAFDKLIDSIEKDGFDKNFPIPLGVNNIIVNGAHRLIASYYYNKVPWFVRERKRATSYNYMFFLNRKQFPNLDRFYSDYMALEYVKLNPQIRCMIVYPNVYHLNKLGIIKQIINKYGYLYYDKEIDLNEKGQNNLIKELYRGERWIGGLFPRAITGKTPLVKGNNPTVLLLIHMNDLSKLVEMKNKCRALFNKGKESLHMSDFTHDTFRISASLLNKNSVHFLNNGTNDISYKSKLLLTNYFKKIGKNNEDFCLTSSLIMEMYGLREAKDIDYLQKDDNKLFLEKTGLHSGKWLTYYHKHKDEIIYNPKYHFYFNGFKFSALEVIKKMKENRNEKKDIVDVDLINKI